MKLSVVGGPAGSARRPFSSWFSKAAFRSLPCAISRASAAEGEALDLRHGLALSHRCSITSGGIEASEGSDFIVITAGIPRQPGETRLDLLKKNVDLMKGVLEQVTKHSSNPFIIMVANPVDVLTYQAITTTGLPPGSVIGTGTLLDTTRFRSLLAERWAASRRTRCTSTCWASTATARRRSPASARWPGCRCASSPASARRRLPR